MRSLVVGGVYWAAPPCSTWIWLSRSTTGRSLTRPRGPYQFGFQLWVHQLFGPCFQVHFSSLCQVASHQKDRWKKYFSWIFLKLLRKTIISVWLVKSRFFKPWRIPHLEEGQKGEQTYPTPPLRASYLHTREKVNLLPSCVSSSGLCVLRCEYLFQKKVYYVIENPVSSLVWSYRPMEALNASDFLLMESENPPSSVSTMTSNLTIIAYPLPFWQDMLKRHRAFAVSVPLGAYGGASEPLSKNSSVLVHINLHAYRNQRFVCAHMYGHVMLIVHCWGSGSLFTRLALGFKSLAQP